MKAGWEVKPLGEVCDIYQPKTIGTKDMSPEGKYTVFGANGIIGRYEKYNHEDRQLLITCRGATCGAVNISEPFSWITGNAMVVRPKSPRLTLHFVEYFFRGAINLEGVITGAAQPQITRQSLAPVAIPIPPLEEQQRIVAILDEAFEGLANARAHAEANLQNARELFETCLSAFIDLHKVSWSSTTLGEAYDVRDGTHDSPRYYSTGHALITSKNLGRDGLHFDKVKFISKEDFDLIRKRSGVHKGDVLFAMIGTIGNPIVVNVEPDFAIKNVALFKMKEGRSGEFLRYMLRSQNVVKKMEAEAKGTTQQFVGLGYLRSFPIILPSPNNEVDLVAQLEQIETQCRLAEESYTKRLQAIDALRQSLLQKAFAGELT